MEFSVRAELKKSDVIIDDGLVGFYGEDSFNPKSELGVDAGYVKKCYDEVTGKYSYASTWLNIRDTLKSKGVYPSYSILTVTKCLFEMDGKLLIKPILDSLQKHKTDCDHIFHDFTCIKIAYCFTKSGSEVEFGVKEDLRIDGLNVEIKRRLGFLKDKNFKIENMSKNFFDGYVNKQIRKGFIKQNADVLIYDVATDFESDVGQLFLLQPFSTLTYTSEIPRLQKGSIIFFSSRQMQFSAF